MDIRIIAGAELHEALERERNETVPRSNIPGREDCFDSASLCILQKNQARRGIVAAHLANSIYGWSVRYDSGLQDFALIASSRYGQLDGSLEDAERFCREWTAADPTRRYAYGRHDDATQADLRKRVAA